MLLESSMSAQNTFDTKGNKMQYILIDFTLTVKAATSIFISGRGSAFSSAKQRLSGSIRNNKLFGPRKRACSS